MAANKSNDTSAQDAKQDQASTKTHEKLSVVVIEDEQDLLELLRFNLERDGYIVTALETGEEGLKEVRKQVPDIVLLDLMLPGMDGLEVCRAIRSNPTTANVPVVMLTAKGEEADIVAGLELGADDYIPKPFSARVVMARMRAVLRRRARGELGVDGAAICVGRIAVDPNRHEAFMDDEPLDLTHTEFRVLNLLIRKPGRVFTRMQIVQAVQGPQVAVTDRSVDVHIVSLRRKLGESGKLIQTVRGVGYRLAEK